MRGITGMVCVRRRSAAYSPICSFDDRVTISSCRGLPIHRPSRPEGLTFESKAGHVRLAVADVAEPLWELLQWVVAQPPEIPEAFRGDWANLCRRVEALEGLETVEFERAYVPAAVLDTARIAFRTIYKSTLRNEACQKHFCKDIRDHGSEFGFDGAEEQTATGFF